MSRYTGRGLPPYRYVPGRSPHPTRHPDGHAFGVPEPDPPPIDPHRWRECEPFLYAVDLFNQGYWWEAHEELEGLWRAAGRRSETGAFLQGLIQVAAALLKDSMGERPAARRMAARGCSKLRRASGVFLGIDARTLSAEVEAFLSGAAPDPPAIRLAW